MSGTIEVDDDMIDDLSRIFRGFSDSAANPPAPSRLKARAYSALIAAQQQSGPLLPISETKAAGGELCLFEKLVQIAPVTQSVQSSFFCWGCHVRILAEHLENAPRDWANCPYLKF